MLRTRVQGRDPFVLSSLRFCDFPHSFFRFSCLHPHLQGKLWNTFRYSRLLHMRPDQPFHYISCKWYVELTWGFQTRCMYSNNKPPLFQEATSEGPKTSSTFSRPLVQDVHRWLPWSSCLVHQLRGKQSNHWGKKNTRAARLLLVH